MRTILAAVAWGAIAWGLATAESGAAEPAEPAKGVRVEFLLPRFESVPTEFKAHPGLGEALKGAPGVLLAEDALFSFSFYPEKNVKVTGFTTRITFDPAKGDVGDIAKAVAGVKGPADRERNETAILMIFPKDNRERLTAAQREPVWKALAGVKGIQLDASRRLVDDTAFGIVLSSEGGAKLSEIAEAFKSAGLPIQSR